MIAQALLPIIVAVVALVAILIGLRLLFGKFWLLAWLRGTAAIGLLAAGIFAALSAWDMTSYQRMGESSPVANISFEQMGEQHYQAKFVLPDGQSSLYEIRGDMWQVDARILQPWGLLRSLGAKPVHRFDRLGGRYYSIEQEREDSRSVHNLFQGTTVLDTWRWANEHPGLFGRMGIEARYGSAAYMPMIDGALYRIELTASGLKPVPINPVAQAAMENW